METSTVKKLTVLSVVVLAAVLVTYWWSLIVFGRKLFKLEAQNFMFKLNVETAEWAHKLAIAKWQYETNITDDNLQKTVVAGSNYATWEKEQWIQALKFPWQDFKDPVLRRQFKKFSILGTPALPKHKEERLEKLVDEMKRIYSTAVLRERNRRGQHEALKNIALEPDLESIFSSGTSDVCELKYYWEGWFGTVGRKVRPLFVEYVNISNEAAKLNNLSDNAAMWLDSYEMEEGIEEKIHKLYLQILPLYKQLHAYVRRKLSLKFNTPSNVLIDKNGPIPAHLLANVWAERWVALYNMSAPYANKVSLDVSHEMKAQNYTPLKMFKLSEEFFTSLNLSVMSDTFWKKSVIEKPSDREIICHGAAWDFSDGRDYRIKMCTEVNFQYLKKVHHEMGHIEYYQEYKDQPYIFHGGANPGFHEAVGDTIALSVSTAEHLMKIGLIDSKTYVEDNEADINFLYLMALEKIAFLPFGYALELWRWRVFRGIITPEDYNCQFWKLREALGGIVPPIYRGKKDFDAGAKFHIISDTPYIRYFISFILQFQFHKALCIRAGQYDPKNSKVKPLHQCDIYNSFEAGNLLRKMLRMGSSKPWQDALEVMTGQRDMDAGPLLEYFQPLLDWLSLENNRTGENVGWTNTTANKACHDVRSSVREESVDECRYELNEALARVQAAEQKYEEKIKMFEQKGVGK